jgi:hypothetical protein
MRAESSRPAHIAAAAVNGMDYLPPIICTPEELMEE